MDRRTNPIFDFSNYITERTHDFTGREWVLAEIDTWLTTPDVPRYFIITGEPGIGKTALAGRLTQIRQFDATHFCIARQADTIDPLNFVRSISHQLIRIEGFAQSILKEKNVQIDVHISNVREIQGSLIGVQIENLMSGAESAATAFSRVVVSPLRQLYTDGFDRQIVILVDALDEAVRQPGSKTIVSLLENARSLPEQVRFLLTARPDADALRYFEELKLPYLQLDAGRAENQKDIREYVRQRFASSSDLQIRLREHNTPVQAFVERVTSASQGNFLYLVWLLRGIVEGTQRFETLDDLPTGLDGIYREFLRTRMIGENRRDWRNLYRPLLGVLAAAQAPLTNEQLAEFSRLSQQDVDDLMLDLRQFLTSTMAEHGHYQLYHQSLPDFFQQQARAKEFWIDLTPFHHQIAKSYQEQSAGYWTHCDQYGFQYLPIHLIRSGQPERLRELLCTFAWLRAKLTATDINALLADYDLVLAAFEGTEDDQALRLVLSALRLSAHILAHDPVQLPSQLHGRLCSQTIPDIRTFLAQVYSQSFWLRPVMPSLTQADEPLVRTLTGHELGVYAVAVTPDGRQVVSASDDKTLKVWELSSGVERHTLTGHRKSVNAVAVATTPEGWRVFSASNDGTVREWDLNSGRKVRTFTGHMDWVTAVAVGPDGRQMVSASEDGTLKVWDLTHGKELFTLTGHTARVNAVTVTPNGKQAISASEDKTLKVWDISNGQEQCTLKGHTHGVNAVAVTSDGQQVVSTSEDRIKIWNLENGEVQRTLTGHADSVTAVAVMPNKRQVVSASWDRTIKIWDLENGEVQRTLTDRTGRIDAVAVAPSGNLLVSASMDDKTLKVWNLGVNEKQRSPAEHTNRVTAIAAIPDGRGVVSASYDTTLKVWDLNSGKVRRTLTRHTHFVNAVAVTPDGQKVISASEDKTLKVWNLDSGKVLQTLAGHSTKVSAVSLIPNGRQAVSASFDGTLKIWDLDSGRIQQVFTGHTFSPTAVTVTPDGQQVVSGSYRGIVKMWNMATGEEQYTFNGHSNRVSGVAVTPDGRQMVSASYDKTLKVWNLCDGKEKHTLTGHANIITAMAMSPDGQWVVSASADRTLKVWELSTGDLLTTFTADAYLWCCAFAPDGLTIVTGDQVGTVHFLRVEKGEPQE